MHGTSIILELQQQLETYRDGPNSMGMRKTLSHRANATTFISSCQYILAVFCSI